MTLIKLANNNQVDLEKVIVLNKEYLECLLVELEKTAKKYEQGVKDEIPFFTLCCGIPMNNIKNKIKDLKIFYEYFNINFPKLEDYPGRLLTIYHKTENDVVKYELSDNMDIQPGTYWMSKSEDMKFEEASIYKLE